MAWIKIKDQIVNSKSIQRMQYLPPGEGGMDRHTLNVFLDSGEKLTTFNEEAERIWNYYLEKVDDLDDK